MKVLYINACVRNDSRTDELAQRLLSKYGEYEEINLEEEYKNDRLKPLDRELLNNRTNKIESGDYSSEMFNYAKAFKEAEIIVISAPYWDLSFPALLKLFIENIYVTGLVSVYGNDGIPHGLCKGKKLYYVTTAGGKYDPSYSYDYVKNLAVNHFGIQEVSLIKAEMLDVFVNEVDAILNDAYKIIDEGF